MGRLIERENIRLDMGTDVDPRGQVQWFCSVTGEEREQTPNSAQDVVIGSVRYSLSKTATSGDFLYTLKFGDIGRSLFVRYFPCPEDGQVSFLNSNVLGPVEPGAPKANSVDILVDGELRAGCRVIASLEYWGGKQGRSEYWWLRVRNDGVRESVTEPRAISAAEGPGENLFALSSDDARVLILSDADIGGSLKVKCRPIRLDGTIGEVVTSKPTLSVGPSPAPGQVVPTSPMLTRKSSSETLLTSPLTRKSVLKVF